MHLRPRHADMTYALDPVKWVHGLGLLQDKQGNPCQLDQTQQEILRSNHRRIIVNCHRQWGKSTISSLLCFHRALFVKRSLCLLVAPSLRQSSEIFRKILDTLHILDSPPELEEDTRLSLKLSNGSRIVSLPGSQRTIRGFSAPDIVVIDEAALAEDELFDALMPMFATNPKGRLILCSTPWGQAGFFFKLWTEAEGWLKIKAIAADNPRITPEYLEAQRNGPNGPLYFAQNFEGEFMPAEGQLISEKMWQRSLDPDIEIIEFGSD